MRRLKNILYAIWILPSVIESHMRTDKTMARILFVLNIPAIIMIPSKILVYHEHVSGVNLFLWAMIVLYQCHWYKCLDMPWQRKKKEEDN